MRYYLEAGIYPLQFLLGLRVVSFPKLGGNLQVYLGPWDITLKWSKQETEREKEEP